MRKGTNIHTINNSKLTSETNNSQRNMKEERRKGNDSHMLQYNSCTQVKQTQTQL